MKGKKLAAHRLRSTALTCNPCWVIYITLSQRVYILLNTRGLKFFEKHVKIKFVTTGSSKNSVTQFWTNIDPIVTRFITKASVLSSQHPRPLPPIRPWRHLWTTPTLKCLLSVKVNVFLKHFFCQPAMRWSARLCRSDDIIGWTFTSGQVSISYQKSSLRKLAYFIAKKVWSDRAFFTWCI